MNVLDLFSGIGGFSLGLERAKLAEAPYLRLVRSNALASPKKRMDGSVVLR